MSVRSHPLASRSRAALVLLLMLTVFAGQPAVAAPKQGTLAILPFDNNAITDADRYAPLSKGLAAMLITDLSQSATGLTLIERSRIEALLKEAALAQRGGVDMSVAVEAGKLLGAQNIAFGSFVVLGTMVRIDSRIIRVETSELVMAESISGDTKDFLSLEKQLAEKMAAALEGAFTGGSESGNIAAALAFSQGVEAWDRGEREEAESLFAKVVQMDSSYAGQVAEVKRSGAESGADRTGDVSGEEKPREGGCPGKTRSGVHSGRLGSRDLASVCSRKPK